MSISINYIAKFVNESNKIEGITREPTSGEILATQDFISLQTITIPDLERLVAVYTFKSLPRGVLRDRLGTDVRVGSWAAPRGGPEIRNRLEEFLSILNNERKPRTAYATHQEYEHLHPFTDGNGRSGRAIWLWQMSGVAPLGFLHTFYYQTLAAGEPNDRP